MTDDLLVATRFGPVNEFELVEPDGVEPSHTVHGPPDDRLADLSPGRYLLTNTHDGGREVRSLNGVGLFGSMFDAEVVLSFPPAPDGQQSLAAFVEGGGPE